MTGEVYIESTGMIIILQIGMQYLLKEMSVYLVTLVLGKCNGDFGSHEVSFPATSDNWPRVRDTDHLD